MNTYQHLWILLLCSCVCKLSKAQNAYTELDKVLSTTETSQPVSYEVKYWFYEDLVAQTPSDSMLFKVVQQKGTFMMEAGDYTIWQQGDRSLTIDHSDKKIYIQQSAKANIFDLSKFKDLATSHGLNLSIEKQNDHFNRLIFAAPQASNTEITITYNPDTYRIERTSLYIDVPALGAKEFNQTRFEAMYFNYRNLKQFPVGLSTFITKRKGVWRGTGKYQKYQIIEIKAANG